MVFRFPTPASFTNRSDQFAALDFALSNFSEKSTATALTDKMVNLGQDIFRQYDVGPFTAHFVPLIVCHLQKASRKA